MGFDGKNRWIYYFVRCMQYSYIIFIAVPLFWHFSESFHTWLNDCFHFQFSLCQEFLTAIVIFGL